MSANLIADPGIDQPSAGSTLSGSSQTFSWSLGDVEADQWWLYVGTSVGAKDIANSGDLGVNTTYDVIGMPQDGSTLYARLWYFQSDRWLYVDSTYTAATNDGVITTPAMTSPANNSELVGGSATFEWSDNNTPVNFWWLYIGSRQGGRDLYDSDTAIRTQTSVTVDQLPVDGSTAYVRLWFHTRADGWQFSDTQYRNDGPSITAQVDTFNVGVEAPWEVIGNVLDNDVGEGLSVTPINGFIEDSYVALNAEGLLRVSQRGQFDDLAPGATRTLSFNYTITDRLGSTASARIDLVVSNNDEPPVDEPPVYVWDDDSYVGPEASSTALYAGVNTIHTLVKGQVQADVWLNEQITLFAPTGRVPNDIARRWTEWYRQVDVLYQTVSNMPNFDQVYRRNDGVNFGAGQKVVGFWESCGAGCGNKTQAEADPGFLTDMLDNPDNPLEWGHWVIYYEMARGGAHEPFYGKATWPPNTVLMPHLMAGISFHHFGGDKALQVHIPGTLLQGLDSWSMLDHEWTEWFADPTKQQLQGAPSSHDLMVAMLLTVLRETDLGVVSRIMDEMTNKPEAVEATQAMCDFQDSIISQTGTRFVSRMKGPWGLPDNC